MNKNEFFVKKSTLLQYLAVILGVFLFLLFLLSLGSEGMRSDDKIREVGLMFLAPLFLYHVVRLFKDVYIYIIKRNPYLLIDEHSITLKGERVLLSDLVGCSLQAAKSKESQPKIVLETIQDPLKKTKNIEIDTEFIDANLNDILSILNLHLKPLD